MMYPKPTHKRRKPEPVVKIQLQAEKECWACSVKYWLEEHHVYEGNGRRDKSELYGLTVYLCNRHHTQNVPGDRGVHSDKELDLKLKQYAQTEFEKVYTRELFIREFGRNYL